MSNLPTYAPKHRAPKHRADLPVDRVPSMAVCTGGLVNEYGKRLTNCRSVLCPRHTPAHYAEVVARHATDSL